MNFHLSNNEIRKKLHPGENLLWWGQPQDRWVHAQRSLSFSFFGLFCTAFTSLGLYFLLPSGNGKMDSEHFSVLLFFVAFLILGLALLLSPLYFYWRAGQIQYAFTNTRLITLTPGIFGFKSLRSWDLQKIQFLRREQKSKSSTGNLTFDREWHGGSGSGRGHYVYLGFYGVSRVQWLESEIRKHLPREIGSEPPSRPKPNWKDLLKRTKSRGPSTPPN